MKDKYQDVINHNLDPNIILRAMVAMKNGDFTVRLPVEWTGINGKIADTFNDIAEMNVHLSEELARVTHTVGTEGKISQRLSLPPLLGTWSKRFNMVNSLIDTLSRPTLEVTKVIEAVARGDLQQRMPLEREGQPLEGEFLRTAKSVNAMVEKLASVIAEVARVAREVGTEGKLGGQASTSDSSGMWRELTNSVNAMSGNLTAQLRNIAEVTSAIANGDLSKKITVEAHGEISQLKDIMNTMVDQLCTYASEVTRVVRELGTDGKLGGLASVQGVAGVWKELTDNVNKMAGNLTDQMRNIAEVTTAVARGDLSKTITVEANGEILKLKDTINTMVAQLNIFASELTRVAREIGTEGKLGGQASVSGSGGIWKDLIDNINLMVGKLTDQVRSIAEVTIAVASGDLSQKVAIDVRGEFLQLKEAMNTMVEQLRAFASEVTRVAREVGTEGKLGGQAIVPGVAGVWKELTDNVNTMGANLTAQMRNIAEVTTAVARGDLSRKITVKAQGEILGLKVTINSMVEQLKAFASEVTRVAREVGTEGKLGGQASAQGLAGVWKDLSDNVNIMAANLTNQVRNIAKVVTSVANGNLKQRLTVAAKGEMATLAETINGMTDTLAVFAAQVTSVAREVGVEGRLGGQANVPGTAGTWQDLTDNVNQLAANLTTQVRAIAEVATAVTKGDLTRLIMVDAKGEVAALKDNVNQMIANLRETTQKNTEQDWLKTNLAKFTTLLQGQRDLTRVAKMILSELAPLVKEQHGVFYLVEHPLGEAESFLKMLAAYAFKERKNLSTQYRFGEGLVGECALEKERILLSNVPGDYIQINSGLGEAPPLNIVVLPVLFEGHVVAVIELASFERFTTIQLALLDQLTESIGIVLNTIRSGTRTEELLKQSQSMAEELQRQQEELQQTNEELEEKAKQLSEQNEEMERKNKEVDLARLSLEEKAKQLALTSKYKSEFLSNMSHELRTPLNSLLILSQQLADNESGNLTPKQVEFSKTIYGSGNELLNLINDILDLSKIESGTVTVEVSDVPFSDVKEDIERTFQPIAAGKGLAFEVNLDPALPPVITTEWKRLLQVLKNLLSNAMKFTEKGTVHLDIVPATGGWTPGTASLDQARQVIAFRVQDTGIGIPREKQQVIFEAFQQADGSTSRKYGGTGLGLAICREIARILCGEILLASEPGQGSTFTFFLPQQAGASAQSPEDAACGQGPETGVNAAASQPDDGTAALPAAVPDDRFDLKPGDRSLLIIEDDIAFAKILMEMAREKGFKALVALRGESGCQCAREYKPDAMTLDLHLPDSDGWTIFDRLKADPQTRHIPIHIISVESEAKRGLQRGAFAYLTKPVDREALQTALANLTAFIERREKHLLIVEDDEIQQKEIVSLLGDLDVTTSLAATGEAALRELETSHFDCMVLDLGLPDMSGFELLEKVQAVSTLRALPIIIYTGAELTEKDALRLKQMAETIIVKDVRSPERLLDEVSLFLHRVTSEMPDSKRHILERIHQSDTDLKGKKVLLVDDDIRNVFALTSVLENHGLQVSQAYNGKEALETLQKEQDIAIVLMDIMMPEMDGFETMRHIRQLPRLQKLPIIALTAKAMKGDREKCIEAGASDYIAKPVNVDQLVSLLRVWLFG